MSTEELINILDVECDQYKRMEENSDKAWERGFNAGACSALRHLKFILKHKQLTKEA